MGDTYTYTPAGQKSYDTYRQPSFKWATNSQQMAGPIHHPHCFLKKHVFQYLFTISHLSHSFLDEENETALFVSTSSPPRKEKVCFRVLNLPARTPHNVLKLLNLPIMSWPESSNNVLPRFSSCIPKFVPACCHSLRSNTNSFLLTDNKHNFASCPPDSCLAVYFGENCKQGNNVKCSRKSSSLVRTHES